DLEAAKRGACVADEVRRTANTRSQRRGQSSVADGEIARPGLGQRRHNRHGRSAALRCSGAAACDAFALRPRWALPEDRLAPPALAALVAPIYSGICIDWMAHLTPRHLAVPSLVDGWPDECETAWRRNERLSEISGCWHRNARCSKSLGTCASSTPRRGAPCRLRRRRQVGWASPARGGRGSSMRVLRR